MAVQVRNGTLQLNRLSVCVCVALIIHHYERERECSYILSNLLIIVTNDSQDILNDHQHILELLYLPSQTSLLFRIKLIFKIRKIRVGLQHNTYVQCTSRDCHVIAASSTHLKTCPSIFCCGRAT